MAVPGALKPVISARFQLTMRQNWLNFATNAEDLEEGPQCVKICPKDALEYTTPDQTISTDTASVGKRILTLSLQSEGP